MSIKIKTISMVRIPPPKCRKYLFYVALTKRDKLVLETSLSLLLSSNRLKIELWH